MRYWLMKSEPSTYSIDDLESAGRSPWEGVRNYQARNFMRDEMEIGDQVLFYHSNAKPSGVAGVATVCSEPYPDFTALDKNSDYFFAKSTSENPIWMMIDVKFVKKFKRTISLDEIRTIPECQDMLLLQKGQRLSIMPLEKKQYDAICKRAL